MFSFTNCSQGPQAPVTSISLQGQALPLTFPAVTRRQILHHGGTARVQITGGYPEIPVLEIGTLQIVIARKMRATVLSL